MLFSKYHLIIISITILSLPLCAQSQTLMNIPEKDARIDKSRFDIYRVSQEDIPEEERVPFASPGGIPFSYLFKMEQLENIKQEWRDAYIFARDNSEKFDKSLKLYDDYPNVVKELAKAGNMDAKAVIFAITAYNNTEFKKVLQESAEEDRNAILQDGIALKKLLDDAFKRMGEATIVTVFADGNIRGVATGTESNDVVGSGMLGLSFQTDNQLWTARISVASSQDTIRADYGSSLLTPGTGGALATGLMDLLIDYGRWNKWHFYGAISQSKWELRRTSDTVVDTTVVNAVSVGFGALWYLDILKGYVDENVVGLSMEFGLGFRFLSSDVRYQEELRMQATDIKSSFYWGPELGMQISFGRITAGLQYYFMNDSHKNNLISGLTQGQVVAGIRLSADIFSGKLR